MTSVEKIEKGVANYIDNEIFALLPQNGWQKLALGTAMSVVIKKSGNITKSFIDNPALITMGVVSEDGVDLELLKECLKENIQEKGVTINLPFVGDITFYKNDVDKLYEYIEGV